MHRPVSCGELRLAAGMDCDVLGDGARTVCRPAPLDCATHDSVSFYSREPEHAGERIGASAAGVVLCSSRAAATVDELTDRTLLVVQNPRLGFIRVMHRFFSPPRPVGIHPTAVIHPEAKLGQDVYIGPFTCVGRAEIGDGTVIDGHAHIYDNVRIGRLCLVQASVVLGGSSFGLERNEVGYLEEFPQIGGVLIADNVSIGRGSLVDRGTLQDTCLGFGVRLDALAVIAHNVQVQDTCAVGCQSVVLGSAVVGESAWIAPHACIREGVVVGSHAVVGMGAVVTRDVPPGATVYGVPAREIGKRS